MQVKPAAGVVLGLVTAVGAACGVGGGGTDGDARESRADATTLQIGSPRERQLFGAVQAYNDAYYTGDARTVRRLRVSLCRELSWEEGLPSLVTEAAEEYGEPQRITSFRARTEGRLAFVTYAFEDPDLRRHRMRRGPASPRVGATPTADPGAHPRWAAAARRRPRSSCGPDRGAGT